jgi:hypothetical protein
MIPIILIWFALLPIVVGFIYSAAAWYSLSRPILFTVGGILEGCIAAAAVLYWALAPLTAVGVSGVVNPAAPMNPLAPYERVIIGVPIVVLVQLFAMYCTHRAIVQ